MAFYGIYHTIVMGPVIEVDHMMIMSHHGNGPHDFGSCQGEGHMIMGSVMEMGHKIVGAAMEMGGSHDYGFCHGDGWAT